MAKAMPGQIGANEGGTACSLLMGGIHPETGEYWTHYQLEGCGWGGRPDRDGNSSHPAPWWRDTFHLVAVTNAGMFHEGGDPVGLIVEDGARSLERGVAGRKPRQLKPEMLDCGIDQFHRLLGRPVACYLMVQVFRSGPDRLERVHL